MSAYAKASAEKGLMVIIAVESTSSHSEQRS